MLQPSVRELKAITMCSAFTLDCAFDHSTIILIGDVYCLTLTAQKTLFNLSVEAFVNVALRVCVPGAQ